MTMRPQGRECVLLSSQSSFLFIEPLWLITSHSFTHLQNRSWCSRMQVAILTVKALLTSYQSEVSSSSGCIINPCHSMMQQLSPHLHLYDRPNLGSLPLLCKPFSLIHVATLPSSKQRQIASGSMIAFMPGFVCPQHSGVLTQDT